MPTPPWLLGDKGFPIRVFCLPIMKMPKTRPEVHFNEKLSSARVLIEQVLGWVKSRFRQTLYVNEDGP